MLAGFVFVDTYGTDLETYVNRAKELIERNVYIPPKYYLEWSGQYEYMLKARESLLLIIPFTLAVIFVLLFIQFRAVSEALIVILSVPFSLIGGAWLMWLLDYNFSIAAAVGFIALAGVAAETGVMMIVYLNAAWSDLVASQTHRLDMTMLRQAVVEGSVQRVRPKVMTACTTIIALLPIMWSTGTGADTMKRIAAPMIGGVMIESGV